MRLFAAVELPASLRARVEARASGERDALPPAGWVRPERLHLTLAFFGEVETAAAGALGAELRRETAPLAPFRARLEGVGGFPVHGPIRVVWLGVEPEAELGALAAAVRRGARRLGVPFDEKPFRPHVTLARCRRPWPPALRERLARLSPADEPEANGGSAFEVATASLMESRLGAGGARYVRLAELPLGAAA